MKNLRKLTAAVLAAVLVLTSMTSVFAADSATVANADKAVTLKDLGLYSGQDANDPKVGLENALTTQDSLIFLAKLFGYNDDANNLTDDQVAEALAKFDDAASISDYAKNVVAYSAANNILSGSTQNGKFFVGAKDTVTAARFATFMLKQMGYTVPDYKLSVAQLAETKGSMVDATVTGDLTRDDAVGVMYGALTAEKASGKTVIADIIGDNADLKKKAEKIGLIETPVVTDDLQVTSVKALNCKQIEVVFNKEMNKDSAESEYFYDIYDDGFIEKELGDSSASLGDDNKTVTITLNKNVSDKLTNKSKAKVIVKKGILAGTGEKLVNDSAFDEVAVEDGIIPTVTKVEATGMRYIKITFSEPVYDGGTDNSIATANFKVLSGTYEYFVQKATLDNNVINLELGTDLIEGPITVTVNKKSVTKVNGPNSGTVNNAGNQGAIADYAGYKVFTTSITFDFVKDTSVSVVTVKSAGANKVVLSFSKPVKGSNIRLYHSNKNNEDNVAKATVTDYVNEITFTFNTLLPSGSLKLYLVNSDDDNKKLVDAYRIKVPDQTLTCKVAVVEPAKVTVKSPEADKVVLFFSEPVKGSNIRLYHSNKNNEDNVARATVTDYVNEITFTFNTSLPGGYLDLYLVNSEAENEKLVDVYGIKVPDQTLFCMVSLPIPNQLPEENETSHRNAALAVTKTIVNKNESITIEFNKELDIEVATDLDNYVVKQLSDNQKIPFDIEMDNSRSVKLRFLNTLADNTEYQLLIKKYQDINGNTIIADYKHIFTTGDYKDPEVVNDPENEPHCFAIAEKGMIFIVYSEPMNEAQMLDKNNYMVSINQGNTYMVLGDDDTITKVNDRIVQIYIKELKDTNNSTIKPNVKIAPIMDLAGKSLYGAVDVYKLENIEPENVHIEEAQLIAKNKIKVTFNKKMKRIDASDFELTNLTTPDSIKIEMCESETINSDGKTEIILVLDKELATDVTDEAGAEIDITTIAAPSSESEWGSKLRSEFNIRLYDKLAPEIVKWDHDKDASTDDIAKVIGHGDLASPQHYGNDYTVEQGTTGSITIYFSEDISEGINKSKLPVDSFSVSGFTITDITAPTETKTVILTVEANDEHTPVNTITVTQVSKIYDRADNAFLADSPWEVTLKDDSSID